MEFRRALVVAPNWIGDALMAQPLLALLAQHHPRMQIDVLAPAHVAPVLRLMPEVGEVIETCLGHGKLELGARLTLAGELRGKRYDVAWVLPNSAKSALIPWLARIPLRIGYRGESRFGLINLRHRNPPRDDRPAMVEHYAKLARKPGAALTDMLPRPTLRIDRTRVEEALSRFGLDHDRPLIALCPGAEYGPAKRWPDEHFAALARLIQQAYPYAQLIALGGPNDAEIANAIAVYAPEVRNLCGKTRLEEAVALLAGADAAICNDSGLMHVCAALDRPQIALFGSSDPRHTPPQSDRATIFWLHLECSPCFKRECPFGHLRCLRDIAPDQVFQALRQLLRPTVPLAAGCVS